MCSAILLKSLVLSGEIGWGGINRDTENRRWRPSVKQSMGPRCVGEGFTKMGDKQWNGDASLGECGALGGEA